MAPTLNQPPPQPVPIPVQHPPLPFQQHQDSLGHQLPFQQTAPVSMPPPQPYMPPQSRPPQRQDRHPPPAGNGYHADLPPLNPVFGVSLEDLYRRDGTAIPMIVYQCIQAIDMFGLNVEGIYRLSGNNAHIARMKSMFNNGTLFRFMKVLCFRLS
jgi:hypothetical protein